MSAKSNISASPMAGRGRWLLLAAVLMVGASSQALAQDATAPVQTVKAKGPGYDAAEQAYQAVAGRQFARAVTLAADAVSREPKNNAYRLLLVDAQLGAGQASEALATLEPLAGVQLYEVESRRAAALAALGRKAEAAESYRLAASLAATPETRAYATRARVLTLVELNRRDQARAEFRSALDAGAFEGSDPVDLAQVAVSVGEDAAAQRYFDTAAQAGPLPGRSALDAAYSAKREGRDAAAVRYFSQGIDNAAAGQFALAPQDLFNVRRDVSDISRVWGVNALASYGAGGVAAGAPPQSGGRGVSQVGGEVYRRIGGYRRGATVEIFGRAFETVSSDAGDATGADTVQGWIGARWKPLVDENLVLEGSRMVKIGDVARNDWMIRAAYSRDQGVDLKVEPQSWAMWRLYADVAHIIESDQTLATVDLRAGRSARPSGTQNTVWSVFASARLVYDSSFGREAAVGAGAGVAAKWWFRESRYAAPRSSVELALQYHGRIAGDKRAKGLFATLSFAY